MNWLNFEVKTRTAPEFIGSDPTQRATWLCMMLYCAEHETGGIIKDCLDWGDRRWMQTCGVTKDEVLSSPSALWKIDGSSLVLWGYPSGKEAEVQAKREGGKVGGIRSGQARKNNPKKQPESDQKSPKKTSEKETPNEAELKAELERKGKERNGIESYALNARVDSIINCRPEFEKLNKASVSKILHDAEANPDFETCLEDFITDAANCVEIKNPLAMLRAYVNRLKAKYTPKPEPAGRRRVTNGQEKDYSL